MWAKEKQIHKSLISRIYTVYIACAIYKILHQLHCQVWPQMFSGWCIWAHLCLTHSLSGCRTSNTAGDWSRFALFSGHGPCGWFCTRRPVSAGVCEVWGIWWSLSMTRGLVSGIGGLHCVSCASRSADTHRCDLWRLISERVSHLLLVLRVVISDR